MRAAMLHPSWAWPRWNEVACGAGPSCHCHHATTLLGQVLVAGARLLSRPGRCRCCPRSAGLGCRRLPQRLHHRVLLLQLLCAVLLLRLAESRESPRLLPRPALAAKRSSEGRSAAGCAAERRQRWRQQAAGKHRPQRAVCSNCRELTCPR
jgi:hypothetical protein